MAHRLILLLLICICVSAETNLNSLKKEFEEFRETAKKELATHKHLLQNISTTVQPLIDQLRNGTTPAVNAENIQKLSSSVKSLGDILNKFENVTRMVNALSKSVDDLRAFHKLNDSECGPSVQKFAGLTTTLNNAALENSGAISELRRQSSNCGGFVELSGTNGIFYQIPHGVQRASCIWVVWAKTGGPIQVSNVYNEFARFDPTFKLRMEYNFTKDTSWNWDVPLGTKCELKFDDTAKNFIYVFFSGNPTKEQQGFHLKMSDSGSYSTVGFRPKVKFIQFDRSSGSFKYPPGAKSTYDNNERVFMIGRVPEGKSLDITVQCDLEETHDFFLLSWQSGTTWKHNGFRHAGATTSDTRTVPEGTSYIMAFISDSSAVRSGARLTYSNTDNAEWY